MTASAEREAGAPATEVEVSETETTVRSPDSFAGRIVFWVGAGVSVLHLYLNTLGTMSELRMSALHFACFAFLCALVYPLRRTATATGARAVLAVDILLGILAAASALYLFTAENALYARGVRFVATDWIFTSLAILFAIEFTRRTTGWIIPVLIVLSLTYVVLWGRYVGGVLHFPGLSAEILLYRSYFGDDGMFGSIARISSTYVFMFILFGAFLLRSGAGEFVINLARCIAGRLAGGPGFVAVLGSGLTGTITGSAVANTVSTGVITIPLMKRAGFPPRFAAGVEASASTGGQLMPPIMGAGAFVMASYTQIPYLTIVAVSFLPAIMYFLSVAFFVRIEAKRRNIIADPDDAPRFLPVLREGGLLFLLPITVLIGLLIYGFTPTYAAGVGILTVIAASWLSKRPMGPRAVLEALALGARNMVSTAVLLVAVGLIVNVIATTGIGNTFSLMIGNWAGGSLLVTIILVALASLVLGMGLPVTAAYIVLATLSAPALFELIAQSHLVDAIAGGNLPDNAMAMLMLFAPEHMGVLGSPMPHDQAAAIAALIPAENTRQVISMAVPAAILTTSLLSAHMIIFWLSQDSNVTPPVCLTAFAAAAIAKTKPMATGLVAWKIAKGLYIIPFLFAYTPFLSGEPWIALKIFLVATIGMYGIIGALEGHLEAPVSWPVRIVLAVAGIATFWPHGQIAVDLVGVAVVVGLTVWSIRRDRAGQEVRAAA